MKFEELGGHTINTFEKLLKSKKQISVDSINALIDITTGPSSDFYIEEGEIVKPII